MLVRVSSCPFVGRRVEPSRPLWADFTRSTAMLPFSSGLPVESPLASIVPGWHRPWAVAPPPRQLVRRRSRC